MSKASILRQALAAPELVLAPGIYDALSAFRAQEAGFPAIFISGSALAATQLARPDIGLMTASETADCVARINERVAIPAMVDADQGFGNSFMVARTVRMMEAAGAAGIQIEDQQEVKSPDAPLGRPLISPQAMVDKIKAARDALHSDETIISARSDAMASESFEQGLERMALYAEVGADMLFLEGITTRAQMEQLVAALGGRKPLLHNLLRATDEVTSAAEVAEIGYAIALFPGAALGAVGKALDDAFASLKADPALGAPHPPADRIGARDYLARK